MIRKKEELQAERIKIDLTGPDGNAYYLINLARSFYKQMGKDETDTAVLIEHMTMGDYEHLLQVFDLEFGMIVDLYR